MRKIRINTAIVASIVYVLMLIIASSPFIGVSFAAMDKYGNRIIFPVPGWIREGPSPWLSMGNTIMYNMSGGSFNPYSVSPKTPHVLWAAQAGAGGVHGGLFPRQGAYEDQSLCMQWYGPIVVGGYAYYGKMTSAGGVVGGTHLLRCIDIETGETKWISDPLPGPSTGYNMYIYNKPFKNGQEGMSSMIIEPGGTTRFIDGETGKLVMEYSFPRGINRVIMGWTDMEGKTEIAGGQGFSADCMFAYGQSGVTERDSIAYCYQFVDYDGNVMDPPILMWETEPGHHISMSSVYEDVLLGHPRGTMMIHGIDRFTGEVLWEAPLNTWQNDGGSGYGKYFIQGDDQYLYGFDVKTGEQVWKSEVPTNAFVPQHSHCAGNGMVFTQGFDGVARAFDAFTGELMWTHYIGDCPYEPYKTWYGTWGSNQVPTGAIGSFHIQTGDHIAHNPAIPGERFYVYNATNGDLMWTYPSAAAGGHNGQSPVPAEGMLFLCDYYTAKLFCFGKGPVDVEMSVPKAEVAKGEYTWITGKVLDASPGQRGTPCVATEEMGPWMEYLHSGMPDPGAGKTGVPVTVYAESLTDGTTYEVGTVTTNGDYGTFSMKWTPPKEDVYMITGVFFGDDAYWDGYGTTTLAVGAPSSASSTTGSTTTGSTTTSSTTIVTMIVATVAAFVLGAVVNEKRMRKEQTKK